MPFIKKNNTLENIVRKEENAGNQHFLLFPLCFLPYPRKIAPFETHLKCRLQMLSIWTRVGVLSSGKENTSDIQTYQASLVTKQRLIAQQR